MTRSSSRTLWIGIGLIALLALFAFPMWGGGMFVGRGMVGPFGVHPMLGFGAPWFLGFGLIALFARLAILGAILFFAVRLFRGGWGRRYDRYDAASDPEPSATEILRRRFASGEITREQYDDMLRTLHPTG